MMSSVTVSVPATTANLGPGFDCIGAALTLYNQFQFTLTPDSAPNLTNGHPQAPSFYGGVPMTITVTGEEASRVSTDETNLVYQSFVKFYQYLGKTPPKVAIEIQLGVPLARGLGSSATAIIGGLVGGNQLAGEPLSVAEIRDLAIALEGHPDNVVPALLGSCQLSVGETGNWQICPINWHPEIIPVVAIPNFELSTQEARSVLPTHLSRQDAIFNIARLGLLIKALETGDSDWLTMALADKLHQPYRQGLIKGYETVKRAAISAGAYGMVISGAGPTLLALTSPNQSEMVVSAMINAWASEGIEAEVRSLALDFQGAKVV